MTKVTNEYPYARLKTGGQYYDTTPKPETIKKRLDAVEDIYETAKASGKTVVINSYEVWCVT